MRFYYNIWDNCLTQHVKQFTRVRRNQKPSLLDLVITEDSQTQTPATIKITAPLGKSDHAVITWDYMISTDDSTEDDQNTDEEVWLNYNKRDYEKMNSLLDAIDWGDEFENRNLEEMLEVFYAKIKTIAEDCIPPKNSLNPNNSLLG